MKMKKSNKKNLFLIDTNVLIDALNKKTDSSEFISKYKDKIDFIGSSLYEFFYFIETKQQKIEDLKILNQFRNYLAHFKFEESIKNEKEFIHLFKKFDKKYKDIGYTDSLLLYNSLIRNLILVTLDKKLIEVAKKEKIKVMTPKEVLVHE